MGKSTVRRTLHGEERRGIEQEKQCLMRLQKQLVKVMAAMRLSDRHAAWGTNVEAALEYIDRDIDRLFDRLE